MFTHIYATNRINSINYATRSTGHIFNIYHRTNMAGTFQICHIAIMLNKDISLTFLNTYGNMQPTSISHVIAKYMPEMNMPMKLGIYAKYMTGVYEGCMHIYRPHKNSLPSIM